MEFTIRTGTLKDMEQIRSIFREAVMAFDKMHYTHGQIDKWLTALNGHDCWQQKLTSDNYVVAEGKKGEIVGFSSLRSNGYLDMLYVKPLIQKRGVATRLVNAVCDMADSFALPQIHTEASLASIAFFEKSGFQVRGAIAKDLEGVHFTKIQLVKKLWVM